MTTHLGIFCFGYVCNLKDLTNTSLEGRSQFEPKFVEHTITKNNERQLNGVSGLCTLKASILLQCVIDA